MPVARDYLSVLGPHELAVLLPQSGAHPALRTRGSNIDLDLLHVPDIEFGKIREGGYTLLDRKIPENVLEEAGPNWRRMRRALAPVDAGGRLLSVCETKPGHAVEASRGDMLRALRGALDSDEAAHRALRACDRFAEDTRYWYRRYRALYDLPMAAVPTS